MKLITKYISLFVLTMFVFNACVHDDEYQTPGDTETYQCADLTPSLTLAQVKALLPSSLTEYTFTTDEVVQAYVSSSDRTGNIYKTLYIQDARLNPTQGLTVSVDAVSLYKNYPQGSKIYIKLKGLKLGRYGGLIQLGKDYYNTEDKITEFGRIPERDVASHIFKACTDVPQIEQVITPKIMTISQLTSANDQYIGCLIQVDNAQFGKNVLCQTFAPDAESVDRPINDPTYPTATARVVRNSGYSSFATQTLPSGNGKFLGILSKYNSTYQFYINSNTDLDMKGARFDGVVAPCALDSNINYEYITVSKAKQILTSGTLSPQITQNYVLKLKVTANDITGNHFKYFYGQDETGGIRINVDMNDMYGDPRFKIGATVTVSLKDLYVGTIGGEHQIGELFGTSVGRITAGNIYKYFFRNENPISIVTPAERTINQITTADVGKWIKIKNVQFDDSELGKKYATTSGTTNRTLKDCSGSSIILRTSNFAVFGDGNYNPYGISLPATSETVSAKRGDLVGILGYFNGTYQMFINNLDGVQFSNATRCDGSIYVPPTILFNDDFSTALTNKWEAVSVTGAQVWGTTTFGNPAPCAIMNGFSGGSNANEDWLVSKAINLSGYTNYTLSFDTDVRYVGNLLQIFATKNYTGTPSTTTWTQLSGALDTDNTKFSPFVNSGNIDLAAFAGGNVYIAFKYTSTSSASSTWELDNVTVLGK